MSPASVAVPFSLRSLCRCCNRHNAGRTVWPGNRLLDNGWGAGRHGIIAAIVVSAREHKEEVAEELKENADTQEMISDATAQALIQTPVALLGALFAMPGGAATGLSVARRSGATGPLVLLLVFGGALFWPAQPTEEEFAAEQLGVPANPTVRTPTCPA